MYSFWYSVHPSRRRPSRRREISPARERACAKSVPHFLSQPFLSYLLLCSAQIRSICVRFNIVSAKCVNPNHIQRRLTRDAFSSPASCVHISHAFLFFALPVSTVGSYYRNFPFLRYVTPRYLVGLENSTRPLRCRIKLHRVDERDPVFEVLKVGRCMNVKRMTLALVYKPNFGCATILFVRAIPLPDKDDISS